MDGKNKAEYVRKLHEQVKETIEKRTKAYAKQANKGRKEVIFEPGDWVWLHLRKERFPEKRKSKLMPRGDGPFQVLERINNNAYKLDLPGEYNVSATFNVSDLSPFVFDDTDSRTNPFEGGGDDSTTMELGDGANLEKTMGDSTSQGRKVHDPLHLPSGPITRARAKKFKDALTLLVRAKEDNLEANGVQALLKVLELNEDQCINFPSYGAQKIVSMVIIQVEE